MAKKPKLDVFRKIVRSKGGNRTKIAAALNMSRRALYDILKKFPKYQEVLDDEDENLLDFTNDQLVLLAKGIPKIEEDEDGNKKHTGWIERPSETALIWLEKSRGKKRGLTDRVDVTSDGEKINSPFLELLKRASSKNSSKK